MTVKFILQLGEHPRDGGGDVRVVLTNESVGILAKIPSMTRWNVPPTMTRGAAAAAAKSQQTTKKTRKKPSKGKRVAKRKAIKKGPKPQKEKKKKQKTLETVDSSEVTEACFRRTPLGRSAIKGQMLALRQLDQTTFPHASTFGDDGKCRLKFQGASKFTWDDVLNNAAGAFEHMYLGNPYSFSLDPNFAQLLQPHWNM